MAMFELQTPDGKTYEVDAPDGNSALQALELMQTSNEGFSKRASTLEPQDLSIARAKDDPFGQYLRGQAMQPKAGEAPEQRERRLYGKPIQGPSKTESFVRGAADTMSWGYGDEMAAGMEAVTGADYNQALDRQRQSASVAQRDNPWSYGGGQAAGAIIPGIVTAGAANAPRLGGRMLQGGTVAAGQGAVYGFGSGEDGFQNRGKEALKTGAISGVLGITAPIVASGVGAAWRGVSNWLANRGVDARSTAEILDMVQQSGLTPQQVQQRLDELGPEGMLADISSGMQVEAGGTARASTEAGSLINDRLAARRMGSNARTGSALDDAFGPAADPYTVRQGTRAAKGAISPEYADAIQNAPALPANIDDLMAKGLTNPSAGLSMTNRKAMLGIMDEIDDALAAGEPSETASRLLNLRQSLDASIIHDGRQAVTLSSADKANQDVLKQARSYIDRVLKDNIPGIAEADKKFATAARSQAAFDQGRKEVMRGGPDTMTPAELNAIRARSNPVENTMRQQGIRTELGRQISNQNANPANKIDRTLQRDWNTEKLASEIGRPKSARLAQALEAEHTFTETSNLGEAARGSRTNVLGSAQRRWGTNGGTGTNADAMAAALGGTAIGGPTTGLVTGASVYVNRARQAIAQALSKKSPDVIRATADKLTSSGPLRQKMVKALEVAAAGSQGRIAQARTVDKIIRLLMASQAPLAGREASRVLFPSGSGGSQR